MALFVIHQSLLIMHFRKQARKVNLKLSVNSLRKKITASLLKKETKSLLTLSIKVSKLYRPKVSTRNLRKSGCNNLILDTKPGPFGSGFFNGVEKSTIAMVWLSI